MQTMYYKTSNFIQHTGNMVDLNEFRRRQAAAAQRDSLARQPEVEAYLPEEEPGFRPVVLTLSPRSAAGPVGSGRPGGWTPAPARR